MGALAEKGWKPLPQREKKNSFNLEISLLPNYV